MCAADEKARCCAAFPENKQAACGTAYAENKKTVCNTAYTENKQAVCDTAYAENKKTVCNTVCAENKRMACETPYADVKRPICGLPLSNNKEKRHIPGGYMTTEAVFIVPWVLFIMVWLIYLGYFEYDRCLAFQEDYALAVQTSAQILDKADEQNWLNGHMGSVLKNKYMGVSSVTVSGSVGSSEVTVSTSMKVRHPLSFHADMIPTGNWNLSDSVSADDYSFTRRLRTFRTVGRVVNAASD